MPADQDRRPARDHRAPGRLRRQSCHGSWRLRTTKRQQLPGPCFAVTREGRAAVHGGDRNTATEDIVRSARSSESGTSPHGQQFLGGPRRAVKSAHHVLSGERLRVGQFCDRPPDQFLRDHSRWIDRLVEVPGVDDQVVQTQPEHMAAVDRPCHVIADPIERAHLVERGSLQSGRVGRSGDGVVPVLERGDGSGQGVVGGVAPQDADGEPVASGDVIEQVGDVPLRTRCLPAELIVTDRTARADERVADEVENREIIRVHDAEPNDRPSFSVPVGLDGVFVLGCVLGGNTRRARLGNMQSMAIKLENVGIAVRDLEAAIAFFTDLGLTVLGRDTVSGEWTDTAVGLDGNHAKIAMLQTPDGHGRLELFEYIHPEAIESKPTRPNEIGMHRVAFSVDDIDEALETAAKHGCRPLRGVATYEDVYKLTYVRGPSGIIVMLAQELKKN